MANYNRVNRITGWVVFAIATTVYLLSAEPTGSLWDCGEFIAGAYKLQVVHPPGAPLFLMVGRMFTAIADLFSNNPETIAYSVNVMSGLCTAFLCLFVFWITTIFGRLILNPDRTAEPSQAETIALMIAGAAAGLSTCFATSVWFSAVEGEVYAMSSFFTGFVVWTAAKWYSLPEGPQTDRWLVFSMYLVGLSIGVHLLSLLTIPMVALLYYLKRWENVTLQGMAAALGTGVLIFAIGIQVIIIKLIPKMGQNFDLFFVNSLGMPFNSGLLFFTIFMVGLIGFGIFYVTKRGMVNAQKILISFAMVFLGFSTYGMIILRAGANTPINMNNPSDAFSLISYLNREQYGDRDLLRGPHFDAEPINYTQTEKLGRSGDRYEIIDRKLDYVYNSNDIMLFPRMHDITPARKSQYKRWMGLPGDAPLPPGRPSMGDNIKFFMNYQLGWMYFRYFMWNFSGRQNGNQGYYRGDPTDGNWISGIPFIDHARLYDMSNVPDSWADNEASNKYYLLPFIFGLIGLFFQVSKRPNEALALFVLFFMTGIAIIIYSNQPPNEPRERDYVLAGSIFTYCIWIGLSVLAIARLFITRVGLSPNIAAGLGGIVLIAPLLMGTQNWDDHSRHEHFGARDYASNFLNSCEENAIVFTHGDNDTYPLWYAQEVEGIRTDVRVVNLSLLAVDWYIDQLRRKVNESDPIKMTMAPEAYRGNKRNSLPYIAANQDRPITIQQLVSFFAADNPAGDFESFIPTKNVVIPVDKQKVLTNGTILEADTGQVVDRITFNFEDVYRSYNQQVAAKNARARQTGQPPLPYKTHERFIKDELAILDIIASNLWDRPIYWAVTCRPEKLMGLQDYLRLEGLALRLIPKKCSGDPTYGDMPIGQGCINTDLMFTNMFEKFRWGNFDTEELFVDQSYMPSVSSLRFAFLRLAQELRLEGKRDQAIAAINKHFEVFPHMNFPYDYNALYLIREYNELGAYDDAKKHVLILAEEVRQHMEFFDSLDENMLKQVFSTDFERQARIMGEVNQMVKAPGYEEIRGEVEAMFAKYGQERQPSGPPAINPTDTGNGQ
ncbi:MAG: DUF2723 domain-containing protein [Bacteroidota bacterium]